MCTVVPAELALHPTGTGLQTGIVVVGNVVQIKSLRSPHVTPQREQESAVRQPPGTSCHDGPMLVGVEREEGEGGGRGWREAKNINNSPAYGKDHDVVSILKKSNSKYVEGVLIIRPLIDHCCYHRRARVTPHTVLSYVAPITYTPAQGKVTQGAIYIYPTANTCDVVSSPWYCCLLQSRTTPQDSGMCSV